MFQHFLHLQRQGKRPKVHAKQKGFKNLFVLFDLGFRGGRAVNDQLVGEAV